MDPDFWKLEEFYDPDPSVPDKSYCKMGGQSGPIEFDTKEWGISPKVMEHTAVDQLFGLVVARQALIDAGYYGKNARPFNRENTGVIMSAGTASHVFSLHVRTQRYKIRQILVNNGVPEAAADMIVANNLKVAGAGFGTDTNVVTFIKKDKEVELDMMSKEEVAVHILDEIFGCN